MKSGQQNKKTLLIFAFFLAGLCNYSFSQSWLLNGNANVAAATQYLGTKDPNDLIFRTNAIERGRVFGVGGAWRFGSATNYAKIDSLGRLTFKGSGAYQVAGNKYVFQYAATPNYGLFFNSTTPQYEFRNSAAASVFTVNAATGAGAFASTLKIGAYTLPATDGTSGQVLKTDGSGTVSWGNTNNNFWSLTGNAGTSPATNFIGTTDALDFVFRTNNTEKMRIKSGGNVGIGLTAPSARLHVTGGSFTSLTGGGNFISGDVAGLNLSMDNNELQARSNGAGSTLYLNFWGGDTWIGNHSNSTIPAIYAATDGTVGIGSSNITAGYALTVNANSTTGGISIADPIDNTAINFTKSGLNYGAFFYKTSTSSGVETIASYNAGSGSGIYASSANGIGVYGANTGGNTSGVYGYSSGGTGSVGVTGYCAGIGYGMSAQGNNGSGIFASSTSNYAGYFAGDVLATSYQTSDSRLKQNIKDVANAMDIINQLHPKLYNYRSDGNFKLMNLPKGNHYGLIAQEVEKILPNLVKESKFETGLVQPQLPHAPGQGEQKPQAKQASETIDFKALNYTELIPLLIKGMQEQQKEIDNLKATIATLSGGKTITSSATGSSDMISNIKLSNASLEQNVPNPLNNTTSIRYNVPAGNASLLITDMNGKAMKTITLQKGAGVVNVDASMMSAGAYSYTLIIDGKTIAAKKMIVAH